MICKASPSMAGGMAARILFTLAALGSLVRSARYDSIWSVPEIFPGSGVVRSAKEFGRAAVGGVGNWRTVQDHREAGG
jgi:hypothetical protein